MHDQYYEVHGQMNIIKNAGSEPTMTVVSVVNKRSAFTNDEDDYNYD